MSPYPEGRKRGILSSDGKEGNVFEARGDKPWRTFGYVPHDLVIKGAPGSDEGFKKREKRVRGSP